MAQGVSFAAKRPGNGFAPRGSGLAGQLEVRSDGSSSSNTSNHQQRTHQFTNVSTELTRNPKYVVSKMAATPAVLSGNTENYPLTASTDEISSHGVLTVGENVYTWNYNSVDSIPTTTQLPGIPSNNGFPPLVLLVAPSAGSSEPGIVSISTHTGNVRFYENVGIVSSIGLLQHQKGTEHVIRLHDREVITIAENIEPAGVLLATNQGRVILLGLRDFAGKPSIKTIDIIRKQTGFFSSVLDSSRMIVSIKAGAILGQGERIVTLISRNGSFQVWSCSSDGQAKKIFHNELRELLTTSIDGLYPEASNSLEVLDLSMLPNFENNDVFLLLTSITNNKDEKLYFLFTVKKDGEHLLIFSAYKLNTYTGSYHSSPKLYVPSPGSVAFIVFDNSVVLAELVTKLDHTLNLKRKWEDVVNFRSDVNIIGGGFENLKQSVEKQHIIQQPSVLVVVPEIGVLRIEALSSTEKEQTDPVATVPFFKSHIEQGVFYGEDIQNPIQFDLPESINISPLEVEVDLIQVAEEILLSKSNYLPPRLSSLADHLRLRQDKLEKLLQYSITNFKDKVSYDVFLQLLTTLQKITAASSLQEIISQASESGETEITTIFESSLKTLSLNTGSSKNATDFFLNGLNSLNQLLVIFFKGLNNLKESQNLSAKIVSLIFNPVIELEKSFRYDVLQLSTQVGKQELWFTQDSIYVIINQIFQSFASANQNGTIDESITKVAIELSELLFYQTHQVLKWLEAQTPKNRNIQELITSTELFYKDNSSFWTRTLVLFNAKNAALAIAETYKDLKSLAEISDEDRLSATTDEEIERVQLRFSHYFNKFGYDFASTLYNYYISLERYQVLLLGFPEYSHYLKKFFEENDHSKISWIKDIFDDDFSKASQVLLNYSQKNSESQREKRLELNIAKLSALASIQDTEQLDRPTENLLLEIQEELDFVEAQSSIFDQISDFIRSDSDPIAQVDSVVNDLLNSRYTKSKLIKKSFERALGRLLTNKTLSVNELIDIFTLLDGSKTGNSLNFYHAFKALHLSNVSETEKETNVKLIWKRVILSDDWSKITSSQNNSNEYIKDLIENTNTFITILHYFQDGLFETNNGYQIPLPKVKQLPEIDNDAQLLLRFKFIGGIEIDELRSELTKESKSLEESIKANELDQLIKGIVGTANEKSGVNKIINYNALSIED